MKVRLERIVWLAATLWVSLGACKPASGPAESGRSERARQVLQRQHGGVDELVMLRGGYLATTGRDAPLRIWDLERRTLLRVVPGVHKVDGPGPEPGSVLVAERLLTLDGGWKRGPAAAAVASHHSIFVGCDDVTWLQPVAADPSALARALGQERTRFMWLDARGQQRGSLGFPPGSDWDVNGELRCAGENRIVHRFRPALDLTGSGPGRGVNGLVVWNAIHGPAAGRLIARDGAWELLTLEPRGRAAILSTRRSSGGDTTLAAWWEPLDGDGPEARALWSPGAEVTAAAFSPDGARLALSTARTVTVIDMARDKPVWTADLGGLAVRASRLGVGGYGLFDRLAFSSDGKKLVVAAAGAGAGSHGLGAMANPGGELFVIDAASGAVLGELGSKLVPFVAAEPDASAERSGLAFDGPRVLVDALGHLQLWSAESGELLATAEVPTAGVESHDDYLSRRRTMLLAGDVLHLRYDPTAEGCGVNGALRIDRWRASARPPRPPEATPLATLRWPPPRGRSAVCMPLPLSSSYVVEVAGGRVLGEAAPLATDAAPPRIVDLGSGRAFSPAGKMPKAWGFARDGRYLLGTTHDESRRALWSAESGAMVAEIGETIEGAPVAFGTTGNPIDVSRDGELAASTRLDHEGDRWLVVTFDVRARSQRAEVEVPDDCSRLAFVPGAHDVVCTNERGGLLRIVGGAIAARGKSDGGAIRRLEIEPSGARAATLSDDGVVRIWDVASAQVLVSLAEFEDGEHIAYTPRGAYRGTPEVAERVAWVFDEPLEAFRFEQFASQFEAPALVARRLGGELVDAEGSLHRPPHVELLGPASERAPGRLSLPVRATSATGVELLAAFVDGRLATQAEGDATELTVPLLPGLNRVSVVAFDGDGYASNPIEIDANGAGSGRRPALWLVSIGVSRYPDLPAGLQLEAADDDARAIVAAFRDESGSGRPFAAIHATTLLDDRATPEAITSALAGLSRMDARDVALVFFAGHGAKIRPSGDMVLVTGKAGWRRGQFDGKGSVSWKRVEKTLARLRGRVVLLLDACHAGHFSQELVVPNGALAATLGRAGRAGVLVFSAAKGRQLSYEGRGSRGLELDAAGREALPLADKQGYFTAALVQSLATAASDKNRDGAIQLTELVDETTRRVNLATQGRQTPWVARREMFGDFVIAGARR
jgi:WD40 repeat protein